MPPTTPKTETPEQTPLGAEAEKLIASGQADALTGEIVPAQTRVLARAAEYGQEYRFSDVIPTPEAWAEFEQVEFKDVVGRDLIIMDAMFLDSLLEGQDEWAIIMFHEINDSTLKTTATGSGIVLPKLKKVMHWPDGDGERSLLPMVGQFTLTPSKTRGHDPYVNLI